MATIRELAERHRDWGEILPRLIGALVALGVGAVLVVTFGGL